MPRKNQKRSRSAKRWNRTKAAKMRAGTLAGISQRIVCDSLEFATLFLVAGGREKIGPGVIARAYDAHGRKVRGAIVPAMLSIERDKASKLMAKAKDAVTIQERKESLRVKRGAKQTRRILEHFDSGVLRFARVDCDLIAGQSLKSVLVGSSDLDSPPTAEWSNMVVCFRGDDGRFYMGGETFDGAEYTLDLLEENGEPISYPSEKAAQRSMLASIELGEIERLCDRVTPDVTARMSKRLIAWERGEKANARYEQFQPEIAISSEHQRVSKPNDAARVRPRDAADSQYSARIGKKRSLRVQPLAEIQLAQNRTDSE